MKRSRPNTAGNAYSSDHIVAGCGQWISKAKQRVKTPRDPLNKVRSGRVLDKVSDGLPKGQRSILSFGSVGPTPSHRNQRLLEQRHGSCVQTAAEPGSTEQRLYSRPSCTARIMPERPLPVVEDMLASNMDESVCLNDIHPTETPSEQSSSEHSTGLNTTCEALPTSPPSSITAGQDIADPSMALSRDTAPDTFVRPACGDHMDNSTSVLKPCKNQPTSHELSSKPELEFDPRLQQDLDFTQDNPCAASFIPLLTSTQVTQSQREPDSDVSEDYGFTMRYTQDSQGNKIFCRLSPRKNLLA